MKWRDIKPGDLIFFYEGIDKMYQRELVLAFECANPSHGTDCSIVVLRKHFDVYARTDEYVVDDAFNGKFEINKAPDQEVNDYSYCEVYRVGELICGRQG